MNYSTKIHVPKDHPYAEIINKENFDFGEMVQSVYLNFRASLSEASSYVQLSSQYSKLDLKVEELPKIGTPFTFTSPGDDRRPLEAIKDQYLSISCAHAFILAMISFEELLKAPMFIFEIISDDIVQLGKINFGSLLKTREKYLEKFNEVGVYQKFQNQLNQHKKKIEFEDSMNSLRILRNCIAHRHGIVSLKETKKTEIFSPLWYKPILDLANLSREIKERFRVIDLPIKGFVPKKNQYQLGEKITLTLEDTMELFFTIDYCAREVLDKTNEILKEYLQKKALYHPNT